VPVPPSTNAGRSTSNFVPQVESYDEETYLCRSGDTLESICQRYYTDDKYARALLLFNRNHPRPASGLVKEPPELRDGQPVYIPPSQILEKYYAYAIPGYKPPSGGIVQAGATTASAPNANLSRSAQRYIVRQAEMISTIARTTLGNLERWSEIYELNGRGFDPSRPLAPGTVLVMPADARIPEGSRQ
jgi:nucleoid-associated protein YgaU